PAAGLIVVKSRSSTWTLPPPNGFLTVTGAVKSSDSRFDVLAWFEELGVRDAGIFKGDADMDAAPGAARLPADADTGCAGPAAGRAPAVATGPGDDARTGCAAGAMAGFATDDMTGCVAGADPGGACVADAGRAGGGGA